MIRKCWNIFLDILYPPKCPACKEAVYEHGAWCQPCLGKILSVRKINVLEHKLAFLDSCQVVCEYGGGLKTILHDMKFRQQKRYAIHLRWLLEQSIKASEFSRSSYVIPVPLHQERLTERGFNQTEVIFKDWAIEGELLWRPYLLERTRFTMPQWELNLAERKGNLKGAFGVRDGENIKNKHIILVDDIITTGITLDECAKVLKKAGAASVQGLTIASGSP